MQPGCNRGVSIRLTRDHLRNRPASSSRDLLAARRASKQPATGGTSGGHLSDEGLAGEPHVMLEVLRHLPDRAVEGSLPQQEVIGLLVFLQPVNRPKR